jgi:anhydro-N-acetylmuramic acid kinase
VHHHHVAYDPSLRALIFKIRESGNGSLSDLGKLAREISLTYARTVNESLAASRLNTSDLSAVAAHGQTLYHEPPNTIQWLDPALIAAEVECPVVSDFRRADLAAGGQGAPLVPFADYILFRHPTKNRVLLNIGGIANITWLKAGGSFDDVIAFDTGPGNCVSDWLMRTRGPAGQSFDFNGQQAAVGTTISDVMREFVSHPFFTKRPPKTTDAPEMIGAFKQAMRAEPGHLLEDLLATASCLVATLVGLGMCYFDPAQKFPKEIIVSGGGAKNRAIMNRLIAPQHKDRVLTTNDLGMPPDAKEALAFALLAAATLDSVPSNVPSVTGAKRAVVLGSITPKP